MPASKVDFTRNSEAGPCEQGATFRRRIMYTTLVNGVETPVNLTGMSARMQVRSNIESATTLLSLTSATNGGITLGGTAGTIDLLIAASATDALPETITTGINAKYPVYDFELVNGSEVDRLFEGKFEVIRGVTR
jgi:hypothetical protein